MRINALHLVVSACIPTQMQKQQDNQNPERSVIDQLPFEAGKIYRFIDLLLGLQQYKESPQPTAKRPKSELPVAPSNEQIFEFIEN